MKRALPRIIGGVILGVILLYAVDYAMLHFRVARNQGYDSVQVDIVYQIPQKGNKAEYVAADPQAQTCVRSIFPHLGFQPCWYLRRHQQQQINY